MLEQLARSIYEAAAGEREYACDLLQRLIRIKSMSGEEAEVVLPFVFTPAK